MNPIELNNLRNHTHMIEHAIRAIYETLENNMRLKESEFGDALLPFMMKALELKRQLLILETSFEQARSRLAAESKSA